MSLLDRALQLERRLKPQPKDVEIIINMNPCYECNGCDKCTEYHKQANADLQGRVIFVKGEEY